MKLKELYWTFVAYLIVAFEIWKWFNFYYNVSLEYYIERRFGIK